MLDSQADGGSEPLPTATVSVAIVLEQLVVIGLSEYDNRVADAFIEAGFEDAVPLKDLVQLLRSAGVPSARALALKAAITSGVPATAQV